MCVRRIAAKALLCGLITGMTLWAGEPASAHQVYLFAWVEGDTVYTESYFGGKKKVAGGEIHVYGPSGKELLSGRTDDQGAFSFPVPRKTDLRIVLEASTGHKAEFVLPAEELDGHESPVGGGPSSVEGEEGKSREARGSNEVSNKTSIEMEEVRAVVEEALDRRLKPIARSLARLEHEKGPGMTEILGGVGYIFGLAGVYLYARARKRGCDPRRDESRASP